jgi:hypothetical protein
MDATFRLRRLYRYQGLIWLPFFLAWFVLCICTMRMDPKIPHRIAVAMAAFSAGAPLFGAGLTLLMLAACWRHELSFRGDRIILRDLARSKDIDLREVTKARWYVPGNCVVLRTDSARLSIRFEGYETKARERIVRHLRSAIQPELQDDWNYFAYMAELHAARLARTKPGPDEILIRRDRWDRSLSKLVAVTSLAGIVAWQITGNLGYLGIPLAPLAGWVLHRATTPARGVVVQKLSASMNGDVVRFLWFLLFWVLVFVAGMTTFAYLRPRIARPGMTLIVGAIVWLGVVILEAHQLVRRQARREREAADLAAKARGEPVADPWRADDGFS